MLQGCRKAFKRRVPNAKLSNRCTQFLTEGHLTKLSKNKLYILAILKPCYSLSKYSLSLKEPIFSPHHSLFNIGLLKLLGSIIYYEIWSTCTLKSTFWGGGWVTGEIWEGGWAPTWSPNGQYLCLTTHICGHVTQSSGFTMSPASKRVRK